MKRYTQMKEEHNDRVREELKLSYSRLSRESLQILNQNSRKGKSEIPLHKRKPQKS